MSVSLSLYQLSHRDGLFKFFLPDEQMQFTALPIDALDTANDDPNRHPVTVLAGDEPVGFFILHEGEDIRDFTPNPNALLLRAYSIDHRHQGLGYAKQSLLLLRPFVAEYFPTSDEVVLAVNDANEVARDVYEKCGFASRGVKRMGRAGWQNILHLEVRPLAI